MTIKVRKLLPNVERGKPAREHIQTVVADAS
jgi:hypothetical protein